MYQSSNRYQTTKIAKIGILVSNLGTPDAPSKKALKVYLKEFLSDKRVIELSPLKWMLWQFVLNVFILNTHSKKLVKSYQTIWGMHGAGSPLLDLSQAQTKLISKSLSQSSNVEFEVVLGMRYGNPSIDSALEYLKAKGIDKILVLPLYPQYSCVTSGSTFDVLTKVITRWCKVPELRFVNQYQNNTDYIDALALSVNNFQKTHGKPDYLLMSYHGIPKRYFDNGDSYPCNCCQTSYLLAKVLKLDSSQYKMVFQSRFGKQEWIKDYTDETLKLLAKKGVKNVQVICPGFSSDCLETLEEIAQQNKEIFIQNGGETYNYIPALNTSKQHIEFLVNLIQSKINDWIILK